VEKCLQVGQEMGKGYVCFVSLPLIDLSHLTLYPGRRTQGQRYQALCQVEHDALPGVALTGAAYFINTGLRLESEM
jgi:hypothetical protein